MSNYAKIKHFNISNGYGIRTAIFFCGCDFHCKNCFNKELQNPQYGKPFTENEVNEIWESMGSHISGISILGGEPLSKYNLNVVTKLCKKFKNDFPDKNIWVWTGNVFDDIKDYEALNYIDVLVDGLFKEEFKKPNLKFRGSSNQRIIDVKETIKRNEIMLLNV